MAAPIIKHHINPGDVFTLCKSVIDICKTDELKISHDHDLRNLVGEMEVMRNNLKTISTSDRILTKNCTQTAPLITRSLKPIHADLTEMQTFLKRHEERKKSVHVLEQARYAMFYKAQLKGWEEVVKRHRESVCAVGDLLVCEENEGGKADAKRRESIFRLEGLVEKEERRRASSARSGNLSELKEHDEPMTEDDNERDLDALNSGKDAVVEPRFNLDVFR